MRQYHLNYERGPLVIPPLVEEHPKHLYETLFISTANYHCTHNFIPYYRQVADKTIQFMLHIGLSKCIILNERENESEYECENDKRKHKWKIYEKNKITKDIVHNNDIRNGGT